MGLLLGGQGVGSRAAWGASHSASVAGPKPSQQHVPAKKGPVRRPGVLPQWPLSASTRASFLACRGKEPITKPAGLVLGALVR
jgi:hypothetical protein